MHLWYLPIWKTFQFLMDQILENKKKYVIIVLRCMVLDYDLPIDESPKPTD